MRYEPRGMHMYTIHFGTSRSGETELVWADVPDEGRAERADDAGERRAGQEAEQHVDFAGASAAAG